MGKRALLFVLMLFVFAPVPAHSAAFEIEIEADSGFYSREDEIVSTQIDFGMGAEDVALYRVKPDGSLEAKPFYLVPGENNTGKLYWALQGVFRPLEKRVYMLRFNEGAAPAEPAGCDEIKDAVIKMANLVPNPYFEHEEETVRETAAWKGDRKPKNWALNDYPWAVREEADLKAQSRLTQEEAYRGKNSIRIVSEIRDGLAAPMVTGSAASDVFALEPVTRYAFSCYVKITDWQDAGSERSHQGVYAEVVFLDSEKNRVPGPTSVYRIQADYLVTRNPQQDYLGKWVRLDASNISPPETRYARVHLSTWWFAGTVYFDNIELFQEKTGTEPVVLRVDPARRID